MAPLPPLARAGHASHCLRCLTGLPDSQVEMDPSKLPLVFYCVGALDLLSVLEDRTKEHERAAWAEWIWEQQTYGKYGTGFRPSAHMTPNGPPDVELPPYTEYDTPHVIVTYTALLLLAILRDDFSRLDRSGLVRFLRACQREDGSFATVPNDNDSDIRALYCAFAISSMLDDWSGVDVDAAVGFITSCRSYEGGYGQSPSCEAQGGTTYTALAALYLLPRSSPAQLTPAERRQTIRWLVHNLDSESGGFRGRTNKDPDACYCFWCGAALQILGVGDTVPASSLATFIASCQFKFGGISKSPGELPDPYHTYLSLAALSMYPPAAPGLIPPSHSASWTFQDLDPLLNARGETARWARKHIPSNK